MTFRHPLRNEFEQIKDQLARDARKPGTEGACARAMQIMMPAFLEHLETERDLNTSPSDRLEAMRGVVGNMARQTISQTTQNGGQREALRQFLGFIESDVTPRLAGTSRLILPGLPGN